METDPPEPPGQLDVEQFADLQDALAQIADSRGYERVLKEGFGERLDLTLQSMFAMSACTRFRSLHEGIVREIKESNPHTVFPLIRAFAETILTVAYATDHPDYVDRLTEPRGEQPKELRRLPIKMLIDHITPEAPGFSAVYDELCEITHFGHLALWIPHVTTGERTASWRADPRWKRDVDALIACAQLKELSAAAETYLHNYVGRYVVVTDADPATSEGTA